ncbi:MAG: helix-turn-helix domain-containing protein [Patescibacteria group bacterium]
MDQLLNPNYILIKEASLSSGYSVDYISRLLRSGKILGSHIGRTWVVSKDSLDTFVNSQFEYRRQLYGKLSESRVEEYRVARTHTPSVAVALPQLQPVSSFPNYWTEPEKLRSAYISGVAHTWLARTQALTLSVFVLMLSIYLGNTAFIPNIGIRFAAALTALEAENTYPMEHTSTALYLLGDSLYAGAGIILTSLPIVPGKLATTLIATPYDYAVEAELSPSIHPAYGPTLALATYHTIAGFFGNATNDLAVAFGIRSTASVLLAVETLETPTGVQTHPVPRTVNSTFYNGSSARTLFVAASAHTSDSAVGASTILFPGNLDRITCVTDGEIKDPDVIACRTSTPDESERRLSTTLPRTLKKETNTIANTKTTVWVASLVESEQFVTEDTASKTTTARLSTLGLSTSNIHETSQAYYTSRPQDSSLAGTTTDTLTKGVITKYALDSRARSILTTNATGLTYATTSSTLLLSGGRHIVLPSSTSRERVVESLSHNSPQTTALIGVPDTYIEELSAPLPAFVHSSNEGLRQTSNELHTRGNESYTLHLYPGDARIASFLEEFITSSRKTAKELSEEGAHGPAQVVGTTVYRSETQTSLIRAGTGVRLQLASSTFPVPSPGGLSDPQTMPFAPIYLGAP